MTRKTLAVFTFMLVIGGVAAASANPSETPAAAPQQPALPGTEEAPGYKDFENGDLSPEDVRELEERREDRNVISPSMQDGQPLPGMNAE